VATTMAAASGLFESAKSIEERKEQTRLARAEVLRQAKANFEKEERRKELKRLRGEDTWMLPDVNERIEQFSQEHSVKKKKKKDKHSKKVKKEKKKKNKKQKYEKNNESADSSSSSEDEWVEAVPSQTLGKEKAWKVKGERSEQEDDKQLIQRDEWMTVDFMSVKTVSSSSLKAEKEVLRKIEQEKAQALEQSKLLERELNPYWKDGGTGLPPEDCSVSSISKSPEDEPIHILSVDEKNKLGAKIIKAEMMGNMNDDQQDVILVRTDQSGRVWPVNTPGKSLESKGGRRKRQMVSTHEEKERVRYFQDEENLSLNDLVKNEKMGTAESQNKLFMRMASKFMGKTDGDYYTLDDMFVSKAAERKCLGEEEENQRKKAIAEHQSLAAQMEKCLYCFDSSQFPKHLIVAIGVKVYLCLPNFRSLTEGHCLIVPLQHHRAATLLDEDIWDEIQMFRKSLVKMFENKGLDCIFLETNMSTKKQYHMVYECIPLPKEVGDMAPIYFK
uniref:CWF19 like cell cycle control factor 2 n=1 Tax=Propithecus coquereli TaxID=379532 RepID=A0A2K6FFU6_PROCO